MLVRESFLINFAGVENLLVAGRCVAGDKVSHAAMRNMAVGLYGKINLKLTIKPITGMLRYGTRYGG